MTRAILSVLLVPVVGDPAGILADEPCGGRVPAAFLGCWSGTARKTWVTEPFANRPACLHDYNRGDDGVTPALVLVWEGKIVPSGCDRAARVLATLRHADPQYAHEVVEANALADVLDANGVARRMTIYSTPPVSS